MSQPWTCTKCGHNGYEQDQFQATGGTFSKLFNVQNKKFVTVSCTRCGYTEIYKRPNDEMLDVIDFFFN